MQGNDLLLLIGALCFTALCAGLEISFVTSNKLYIHLQRKQGVFSARLLGRLLQRPERVIAALQVGTNIALVVYGIVMARLLEPWLWTLWPHDAFVLTTQTLLSTLLVLIVAEYLPKVLFRMDPNGLLSLFAVPLWVIYVVLWVPTLVFATLSELILRLGGVQVRKGQLVFGRVDLSEFLREMQHNTAKNATEEAEVGYFRNTLALSETKARDRMVPRAAIEAIGLDEPVARLQRSFIDTGLSKLLVYKDSIDNIVGYVHGYEMLRKPRSIRSIVRPVQFIPGTMPVDQVLQLFTKQRCQLAVVVDEFGGTAGMLTVEDAVETIVGEIDDEHDMGETVEEKVGEHAFLFSGTMEVAHLRERYGLDLPLSAQYDTLAGYILHHTGELPSQGQELRIEAFQLTIAQVVRGRIELVRLTLHSPPQGRIA
jgi:putative hemolysin